LKVGIIPVTHVVCLEISNRQLVDEKFLRVYVKILKEGECVAY